MASQSDVNDTQTSASNETSGDNVTHPDSRTTGSSDMRKFVSEKLASQWSRALPAPGGIGIQRLRKLLGFLTHIHSLDTSQQSHFGPSKQILCTLFLRLFGEQLTGTKATVYQALFERVQRSINDWPTEQSASDATATSTSNSVPAPAPVAGPSEDDLFWEQFALTVHLNQQQELCSRMAALFLVLHVCQ